MECADAPGQRNGAMLYCVIGLNCCPGGEVKRKERNRVCPTPVNANADAGRRWWSLGSKEVSEKWHVWDCGGSRGLVWRREYTV